MSRTSTTRSCLTHRLARLTNAIAAGGDAIMREQTIVERDDVERLLADAGPGHAADSVETALAWTHLASAIDQLHATQVSLVRCQRARKGVPAARAYADHVHTVTSALEALYRIRDSLHAGSGGR